MRWGTAKRGVGWLARGWEVGCFLKEFWSGKLRELSEIGPFTCLQMNWIGSPLWLMMIVALMTYACEISLCPSRLLNTAYNTKYKLLSSTHRQVIRRAEMWWQTSTVAPRPPWRQRCVYLSSFTCFNSFKLYFFLHHIFTCLATVIFFLPKLEDIKKSLVIFLSLPCRMCFWPVAAVRL